MRLRKIRTFLCNGQFIRVFIRVVVRVCKSGMNLEEDLKGGSCFLDGCVVCISVLLYEWSQLQERREVVSGCATLLQLLKELNAKTARSCKVSRTH